MTARAPAAHPRSASADAPTAVARATSNATRRIDVHWHAEDGRPAEKATINVYRGANGVPMIEIVAAADSPVTVSYAGPIEDVEDVDVLDATKDGE